MEQTRVQVPADVLAGLEAVRLCGKTNMLEVPRVIELAIEMGYPEAGFWVYENRRSYAEGIFRGFEAEEGGDAECVDK